MVCWCQWHLFVGQNHRLKDIDHLRNGGRASPDRYADERCSMSTLLQARLATSFVGTMGWYLNQVGAKPLHSSTTSPTFLSGSYLSITVVIAWRAPTRDQLILVGVSWDIPGGYTHDCNRPKQSGREQRRVRAIRVEGRKGNWRCLRLLVADQAIKP